MSWPSNTLGDDISHESKAMKKLSRLVMFCLLAASASAQTLITETAESDRPQIDIESYSIEVTIDPFESELFATAELRFVQLDRQDYAVFDLDRRLRVRDVYLGEEEPLPVRFRQFDLDSTLEVDLSDLGQFDQPFLRIEYDGILNPEEGRREPILSRIAAENAFLLYDAKWFPLNGLYRDMAMMELNLTVPSEWQVVTGLTGNADVSLGDTSSLSFVGSTPSFWGSLVAGRYETVATSSEGGPEVEVMVSEDATEAAAQMGEDVAEMLSFYTETFGESRSATFRLVAIDGANWESRSAPGMLLLPSSEFRSDFDPWDLARHVANQWFPLTYSVEDPRVDAWLANGLAVFSSLFYFEETFSPLDAEEYVERAMVKALSYEGNTPVNQAGSFPEDSVEFNALAAYKGGYILRMLRDVVGEEPFAMMLHDFPTHFADKPLSTSELLQLASASAGDDLSYFFDQWLNSSGVPEFTREYTVFRLRDGYKVMGQINQDLDLFRMPVEIEVLTDGEPEYHRVWVSGPSSDFDLITERKPRAIVLDPNRRMLRLSDDMKVSVHISRGEDLSDDGNYNAAIDEFQSAVDLDRLSSLAFFRMGEALFELGNLQASANVFREVLNGDLAPRWVEVWAYVNLGKIYDIRGQRERAVTEYQKAVNTGDDAYGAQDEAEKYVNAPFRRSGRPTIG